MVVHPFMVLPTQGFPVSHIQQQKVRLAFAVVNVNRFKDMTTLTDGMILQVVFPQARIRLQLLGPLLGYLPNPFDHLLLWWWIDLCPKCFSSHALVSSSVQLKCLRDNHELLLHVCK